MVYKDPRQLDPDYQRSQRLMNNVGKPISLAEAAKRAESRDKSRELDLMIDAAPNFADSTKEANFAFSVDRSSPPKDYRMHRPLPPEGEERTLLSSRQRKARSKAKHQVQDDMPYKQYDAMRTLLQENDGALWGDVNDALHDVMGDAANLDEDTERIVRRVDRAIEAYERAQDRGHLVYSNVLMPAHINRANVAGYARNQFEPGSLVEFDRFTAATHCLHEIEAQADPERDIAFEISTTRGMYLGSSDSTWNTPHLLPRGIALYSHGVQTVTYQRPDGTTGTRVVVQLSDEPPKGVTVITPADKLLKLEKLKARRAKRAAQQAQESLAAPVTRKPSRRRTTPATPNTKEKP